MENSGGSVYTLRYETSGNRSAAGTAAPTGDPAAQSGDEPVGSGACRECVGQLSVPVGGDVPTKGHTGTRSSTDAGAPPRLSRAQRARLERVLLKGSRAAGYPTELWTLARVAEVIWRLFGIRYHPSHVWRLLHQMDWSCQKPERRAVERDEAAIEEWKRRRWPHIKKRRTTWRPSRVH